MFIVGCVNDISPFFLSECSCGSTCQEIISAAVGTCGSIDSRAVSKFVVCLHSSDYMLSL